MYKNFQRNNPTKPILSNKTIKNINKIGKSGKSSKSLEKKETNVINKNKYKNKLKLRQHNNQNENKNKEEDKIRAKSKSDLDKRAPTKLLDINDIETERINIFKSKSKKKLKNIRNNKIKQYTSEESKFQSDIDNNYFFSTYAKTLKINLKKISKNTGISEFLLKDTTNFENLKYASLDNVSSLFKAWQKSADIYKTFAQKLMKKKNFEIDEKTLKIKTKNHEANAELNKQKFWILYTEYLIDKNYILNENQFLSVMNEAFSYMDGSNGENNGYQCNLLKRYYLEKIKKYSPCFLPDGSFDDNDDTYINKLNQAAINLINKRKRNNISFMGKKFKISNGAKNEGNNLKDEKISDKNNKDIFKFNNREKDEEFEINLE